MWLLTLVFFFFVSFLYGELVNFWTDKRSHFLSSHLGETDVTHPAPLAVSKDASHVPGSYRTSLTMLPDLTHVQRGAGL